MEGGSSDSKEDKSMSAPVRICARMLLVTGGGSRAVAFGGMGIGIAENRVKGDFAWGRVLGGKEARTKVTCGPRSHVSTPGAWGGAKKREKKEVLRGKNWESGPAPLAEAASC